MIEDIKNAMVNGGASWILWVLFGVSILAVAIMLDRARVFWAHKDNLGSLVRDLNQMLGDRNRKGAEARLTRSPNAESAIVLAGLAQWDQGKAAVREAMAVGSGLARARLEKRLLFLGTVGNNAPFVGLLGTVIGVLGAFNALGQARANDVAPERVMGAISESLVATAVGLLVAIPCVMAFNYFQGRAADAIANGETLGHVLLTHLETSTSVGAP